MDEKGISQDGRVGVLNPRQYYALIQQVGENGLINRDPRFCSSERPRHRRDRWHQDLQVHEHPVPASTAPSTAAPLV